MNARNLAPLLPDLHLLVLLSSARSYTQVATQMGISKSSVSVRIKALERAAGLPLVRRTTRSVRLTSAGEQLAERMKPPLDDIESGFSAVRDLAGTPRGVVRLTVPVALGRQWITPTLPALLHRYPELRLEVDLNDRLVNLTRDGFDIAVRHTSELPGDCIATVICSAPSLLLASADYLKRRGVPRHPAELAQHDCLLYLRDAPTSTIWHFVPRQSRGSGDGVAVSVSGPLRANNSEALRDGISGGLGIGLIPSFSAPTLTGRRRFLQVLPDWKPVDTYGEKLYALRPWAPRTPRAVECVLSHLRQTLENPAISS